MFKKRKRSEARFKFCVTICVATRPKLSAARRLLFGAARLLSVDAGKKLNDRHLNCSLSDISTKETCFFFF